MKQCWTSLSQLESSDKNKAGAVNNTGVLWHKICEVDYRLIQQPVLAQIAAQLVINQVQEIDRLLLIELILLHRPIKKINLEFLYLIIEIERARSGQVRDRHAALNGTIHTLRCLDLSTRP